jgi:hypothetical protein
MGEATEAEGERVRGRTSVSRGDGDLYSCESSEDAWRGA